MEITKVKLKIPPFIIKRDDYDRGFELKRKLTVEECRYLLEQFLGIVLCGIPDFASEYGIDNAEAKEEFDSFNEDLQDVVNKWLEGDSDDTSIMEYAWGCESEPIGIWNAFSIVMYLISINVIEHD